MVNLHRNGFRGCAEYVLLRVLRSRNRLIVAIDEYGDLRIREPGASRYKTDFPADHIVGNYGRDSSVKRIEDDIKERQKDLRPIYRRVGPMKLAAPDDSLRST